MSFDEEYIDPHGECAAEIAQLREALSLYAPGTWPGVIAEVAVERRRQVEQEGWTAEHDDEHGNEEMACAAACYAIANKFPGYAEKMWPWDGVWWKPSGDRRNLIKAAALLVAEIERLDRAARTPAPTETVGALS